MNDNSAAVCPGEAAPADALKMPPISFIGLGRMGEPMARNLARAGLQVTVWNRSPPATRWFSENRLPVAASLAGAFDAGSVIILMLANASALSEVLGHGTSDFACRVAGRTIVNMGTISPEYSAKLAEDVAAAGGRFVECPVSGSRVPAEEASLVAMVAGEPQSVTLVREIIRPMCARSFVCGAVPNALVMKLAINHYLITMVTALAESLHFAQSNALDLRLFREIIAGGPMASKVATGKIEKVLASDLSAQASLGDVLMNSTLIYDRARALGVSTPLLEKSLFLYREAEGLGLSRLDMIAVIGALESLTANDRSIAAREGWP